MKRIILAALVTSIAALAFFEWEFVHNLIFTRTTHKLWPGSNGEDFPLVYRHRRGTEFEDGSLAVLYWPDGKTKMQQGVYRDNQKVGIWTFWNKDGTLKSQHLYEHRAVMESRVAAPWWPIVDQVP